ncbi:MAG: hypothetical protein H7A36_01170 [Chlamydiales bacterium]|nr:hypothetical protein [Chlamydiales bacterium]
MIYSQDDPSCGQTVRHHHDQVVAFDETKMPLRWTAGSLKYMREEPASVGDAGIEKKVEFCR